MIDFFYGLQEFEVLGEMNGNDEFERFVRFKGGYKCDWLDDSVKDRFVKLSLGLGRKNFGGFGLQKISVRD